MDRNVAGGSPAASVFLLFGQRKVTKENAALQNRRWRGSLRYSKRWAPAELARTKNARTQTVLGAFLPSLLCYSAVQKGKRSTSKPIPLVVLW